MTTTVIDSTTIYRTRLDRFVPDEGEGAESRRREHAAEAAIIREFFGPRVRLEHDANGAPRLVSDDDLPLPNISISHSRTEIVIAVDDDLPIGVDIENWRNQLMRVASRVMTPEESELYNSAHAYLRAWTIKEALFKAAGKDDMTMIDCHLPLGGETGYVEGVPYSITLVEDTPQTVLALARPVRPE